MEGMRSKSIPNLKTKLSCKRLKYFEHQEGEDWDSQSVVA